MSPNNDDTADICLLLEGSYPYVSGGVSEWTHQMILALPEYKFHLACLLPPQDLPKIKYELPKNVVGMTHIFLQRLPLGSSHIPKHEKENILETITKAFPYLHQGSLSHLKEIINALHPSKEHEIGSRVLIDSEEAWELIVRLYQNTMKSSSFLNFFWSWRSLISAFYSTLLAKLPKARIYHALSTGYAGLLLARAHIENERPCIVTEHGIYTNERKIEILTADWLDDRQAMNLSIEDIKPDLKDFWIDTFSSYSRLCYNASSSIITLFKDNQDFQLTEGANKEVMRIIPNGIDESIYSAIPRNMSHPPTVALIGRVVPIKDIKTFIRAIERVYREIPNLKALIIGPTDEDKDYFQECKSLVESLSLDEVITFTGKVNLIDYFGKIDVVVLTSLSESQPLSILEAGASGIPSVATDVGSCRELIEGRADEVPRLHAGGLIRELSNPTSIAEGILMLFKRPEFYAKCSEAMRERVKKYYRKEDQIQAYRTLYQSYLKQDRQQENASAMHEVKSGND